MVRRQMPPGRTSISWMVVAKPCGPHHCARCCGSVQAANTSWRGASKMRVKMSSRSAVEAGLTPVFFAGMLFLLGLQFLKVGVQTIEALFPELAVMFEPVGGAFKRRGVQTTGTPLCFAALADEAGAFEHAQVLGDRRKAHGEGLGELRDREFARSEAREDGAASRIGESSEGGGKVVGGHLYLTYWLNTRRTRACQALFCLAGKGRGRFRETNSLRDEDDFAVGARRLHDVDVRLRGVFQRQLGANDRAQSAALKTRVNRRVKIGGFGFGEGPKGE